ncbi:hypothetical protein EV401DRAFT_2056560 [Pisolithus croceorrhizus]|nr:hypothetical protein EV401DRAFT_2056560 [Pisolithus croceorrhizus]
MDIPLELVVIFNFVLKPYHLEALCLVNRAFNRFATPLLYRHIYIFPWHKDSKSKVFSLFRTLVECPHLAGVRPDAEIRDFPKGLSTEDHSSLSGRCVRAIRQCTNLKSCTWTKDGSLHSELLESLLDCQQLGSWINGNSADLRKISLIMPSVQIICKAWNNTSYLQQTLNKCVQASTHVTDGLLESLSPNLAELECLHILDPKVTHKGIGALVSANRSGLFAINLEHLSLSFDMSVFRTLCHRTQAFRRLRTITLTVPAHTSMLDWARDVYDLVSSAPLEAFQLYSTDKMVTGHGSRLKRISVHRIRVNLATPTICSQCPRLEQLFVETERRDLTLTVSFSETGNGGIVVSLARNLRSTHNLPLGKKGAHGAHLVPRENPEIPEQFLVGTM